TPAAHALRQAQAVMAWAHLQMTCDLPEVDQWLHPDFLRDGRFCRDVAWGPGDGIGYAGPYAYEVVEMTHNDDGTVDITTCAIAQPHSRYDVSTHEPAGRSGEHHRPGRSRLIPHGDSYRFAGSSAPTTTTIETCEPSAPITVQHFVDWQDTPRFTRFRTGPES
ncbi:hypothetical protein, partial [Cellulomonas sp. IC4_254]|uniref:hypothetical protein n=1 Tax=Cellulomonas sp. IC4_254 TaxID=2714040 RepID=UPI00196A3BCA